MFKIILVLLLLFVLVGSVLNYLYKTNKATRVMLLKWSGWVLLVSIIVFILVVSVIYLF